MKQLILVLSIFSVLAARADNPSPERSLDLLGIRVLPASEHADSIEASHAHIIYMPLHEDIDTILTARGMPVHVHSADGNLRMPGLPIFTPAMRGVINPAVASYAEAAALDHLMGWKQTPYASVKFTQGSPRMLTAVTDSVPFTYQCTEQGVHIMQWEPLPGHVAEMQFELDYLILASGSRSGAEAEFISALANVKSPLRIATPSFNPDEAEDYKSTLMLVRGPIFRIPEVSRNLYLTVNEQGEASPVYAPKEYPCESLSNMCLYGVENIDPELDITFITHTWGKTDKAEASLGRLLALCRNEGCVPYFGIKSLDADRLRGTIFMHNEALGYLHIFDLDMPLSALSGKGEIKTRASLFVPVNNLADLYYEQRARKTPIKIEIAK